MKLMPALYWEDYAEDQVERIFSYKVNSDLASLDMMRNLMDEIISKFFVSGKEMTDQEYWLKMAAMSAAVNMVNLDSREVTTILIKKQRDYGPENIARFGLTGIIIRMHDKIARLENLISSGQRANNESVQDTFIDIIGYSAIALMWMNNQFLTPLREA